MNLLLIQTKRIRHHAETGETHSSGAKHRIELPAQKREPDSRRQRNADYIVNKRPEKIFMDIA